MAIPILPLMLFGVGVLVLRGRRRSKKKDDEQPPADKPVQTFVYLPFEEFEPPQEPEVQPGASCDAPDGLGALDELGECKTFWINGDTDEAIRRLAREEWEARGRPGVSEFCLSVYDEMEGELAAPQPNPRFVEVVVAALQRYYGVGTVFPPVEAHGWDDPMSPYWVHMVWDRAVNIVQQELCSG